MNIKRSTSFFLEKRKKNGELITENVPIIMRVTFSGMRVDFTTGYRIDTDKWDKDGQKVKKGCTNKKKESASEINDYLNSLSTTIGDIFKGGQNSAAGSGATVKSKEIIHISISLKLQVP